MNIKQLKAEFPFSYIGGVNTTAKMLHGEKYNIDTFAVYLAPSKSSGHNVCAKATTECIMGCLNTSGRVKMDAKQNILNARKNRTIAFYEKRELFMRLLNHELTLAKKRAEKKGSIFAVRLNGTSDLSPVLFKHEGKALMELYPDTTFYDYSKIENRVKVMEQYPNYDLTFSYSGYNWNECEKMLQNNVRVAAIFDVKRGKELPKTFNGYEVIDGDETDYRPANPKQCIVGLRWKNIANKANNETIRNSPFVVRANGLQDVIVTQIENISLAA